MRGEREVARAAEQRRIGLSAVPAWVGPARRQRAAQLVAELMRPENVPSSPSNAPAQRDYPASRARTGDAGAGSTHEHGTPAEASTGALIPPYPGPGSVGGGGAAAWAAAALSAIAAADELLRSFETSRAERVRAATEVLARVLEKRAAAVREMVRAPLELLVSGDAWSAAEAGEAVLAELVDLCLERAAVLDREDRRPGIAELAWLLPAHDAEVILASDAACRDLEPLVGDADAREKARRALAAAAIVTDRRGSVAMLRRELLADLLRRGEAVARGLGAVAQRVPPVPNRGAGREPALLAWIVAAVASAGLAGSAGAPAAAARPDATAGWPPLGDALPAVRAALESYVFGRDDGVRGVPERPRSGDAIGLRGGAC